MRGRESRSRLFRSSCSRRSREIASGHYGRLLTTSPPTSYLAVSPLLPGLLLLCVSPFFFLPTRPGPTLTNLFQPPTNPFSPTFLYQPLKPGPPVVCGVHQWRLRPPGCPLPPRVPIHRQVHTLFTKGTLTDDRTGTLSVSPPLESRGAVDRPRQPRRPSSLTFLYVSSALTTWINIQIYVYLCPDFVYPILLVELSMITSDVLHYYCTVFRIDGAEVAFT